MSGIRVGKVKKNGDTQWYRCSNKVVEIVKTTIKKSSTLLFANNIDDVSNQLGEQSKAKE